MCKHTNYHGKKLTLKHTKKNWHKLYYLCSKSLFLQASSFKTAE